uniref:Uncharacterized protein n=1 Tax=Guillardia theta TaxID=55529 RepID=A0A7S4P9U9_GUITH|mmetsp:Transcript_46437/g.145631  ORF Transcript_46437/g.145631 Transcript_46437/m.145631 type:complete len:981 (+) Transcript_46437:122-3064(+)
MFQGGSSYENRPPSPYHAFRPAGSSSPIFGMSQADYNHLNEQQAAGRKALPPLPPSQGQQRRSFGSLSQVQLYNGTSHLSSQKPPLPINPQLSPRPNVGNLSRPGSEHGSKPPSPLHSRPQSPSIFTRNPSPHRSHDLTPRRIGPTLRRDGEDFFSQCQDFTIHHVVHINAKCQLVYLTPKVAFAVFGDYNDAETLHKRHSVFSSSSVWATGNTRKKISEDSDMAKFAGAEVAKYLGNHHRGKHFVVLSSETFTSLAWQGHLEVVDCNAFEPLPLSQGAEIVRRLLSFLRGDDKNVLVFMRPNVMVASVLISLMDENVLISEVFRKLSQVNFDRVPLAGEERYLAMLDKVSRRPDIVQTCPSMTVGTLKLYGDVEFVRSTENLIRVHIELHHSGYIDSTDFREQTLYRVLRSNEIDACLVVHFLPIALQKDIRILIFSTLAGDMGLITGPQPMLQINFHTSFVDCNRPLVFEKNDLDRFQTFCPVTRVEFIPGPRNDEQLSAPEVKFVRKKVKRKSSPLNLISDFLNSNPDDEEEKSLESGRPQEIRQVGKVYRDDAKTSQGTDFAYSLPDEYTPSLVDSGRATPDRSSPGRIGTPTRLYDSGRQTPTRFGTPLRYGTPTRGRDSGRQTPVRSEEGERSGRITPTRGPPSPRIPVPSGAALDGEVAPVDGLAIFLNAPRMRFGSDGRRTPDGRVSPGKAGREPLSLWSSTDSLRDHFNIGGLSRQPSNDIQTHPNGFETPTRVKEEGVVADARTGARDRQSPILKTFLQQSIQDSMLPNTEHAFQPVAENFRAVLGQRMAEEQKNSNVKPMPGRPTQVNASPGHIAEGLRQGLENKLSSERSFANAELGFATPRHSVTPSPIGSRASDIEFSRFDPPSSVRALNFSDNRHLSDTLLDQSANEFQPIERPAVDELLIDMTRPAEPREPSVPPQAFMDPSFNSMQDAKSGRSEGSSGMQDKKGGEPGASSSCCCLPCWLQSS